MAVITIACSGMMQAKVYNPGAVAKDAAWCAWEPREPTPLRPALRARDNLAVVAEGAGRDL